MPPSPPPSPPPSVAIIGAGPAGLMAAQVLAEAGLGVDIYDAMPGPGRKFLRAGVGGLNITHSEDRENFLSRYAQARAFLEPQLREFSPSMLRRWLEELGTSTFVGSSGRVFPQDLRAAPTLRSWLRRLDELGVRLHLQHRWLGFAGGAGLLFDTPAGARQIPVSGLLLALGGASWPRLGSTGTWTKILAEAKVQIHPWRPANCGFCRPWSAPLLERHAGAALKNISARIDGLPEARHGELIISSYGLEGGLIYALGAPLRDAIEHKAQATLFLDLLPGQSLAKITASLHQPRGKRSMAEHLRRQIGLEGAKAALLREILGKDLAIGTTELAAAIKSLPVTLQSPRPLQEAISSAGGLALHELDPCGGVRKLPGLYCAGEMLDWEAPTGGYLLHACLAGGRAAAKGMQDWLRLGQTPHWPASPTQNGKGQP